MLRLLLFKLSRKLQSGALKMRGLSRWVWFVPLVVFGWMFPLQAAAKNSKPLQIFSIDVEGGQATMIIGPAGHTMLIDTGWPGKTGADRVVAVAQETGVKKLDYVVITHFHHDHVGGVPDLIKQLKVGTF